MLLASSSSYSCMKWYSYFPTCHLTAGLDLGMGASLHKNWDFLRMSSFSFPSRHGFTCKIHRSISPSAEDAVHGFAPSLLDVQAERRQGLHRRCGPRRNEVLWCAPVGFPMDQPGLMMEKEVAQVIELAGRGTGHVEYVWYSVSICSAFFPIPFSTDLV